MGEQFMRQPKSKCVNRDQYDAILFDLDGVITNTANLHANCWKQMFDEYLQKRAIERGEEFRPFDLAADYRLYVDGKPRFDGVRDFLRSRGIQLPEGKLDDPGNIETVHGLGNCKDHMVNRVIAEVGVEAYTGTVQFIHQVRRDGFKIAVVTSSQHCDAVLRAAMGAGSVFPSGSFDGSRQRVTLGGGERGRLRDQAWGDSVESQWSAHRYDRHSIDR